MCGICGIIGSNNAVVQEKNLFGMMRIMKHRGPDDEGVFVEKNIGLGFVRLSIIDLSQAGHQPKLSSDGNYVIVFNGEIYNYIELRDELINEGVAFETQTDTEVLLNAYIQWGVDCLHRFNGMWAIAIYNCQTRKLLIARDRYGIKPFYFLQTADQIAFCSEIPPLLSLMGENNQPDYQSIFDFLVFNRTDQTERTFFSNVKKLQHGHYLVIDLDNIPVDITKEMVRWYDLRKRVQNTVGFEHPNEFAELFASSINLRLRSDVPVGVCLSGGVDSSSIVSILLRKFQKTDLKTFSAVYKTGQYGDESKFIHEYKPLLKNMFYITPDAKTLEDDLHNFVKAHGEPIPSTSPYAQFKVMELAKGNVVVTLDGQGADEEFAGYHYFFGFYFKDLLKHGRFGKLLSEMYHYLVKHKSLFGLKSFLYFMLPKHLRTQTRVNEKGYLKAEFISTYKKNNSISGNLYGSNSLREALLDHFEYKLEHLLKWEDRNSMHFSLEARVPFLDYRIVEKVLATSGDLKIKNGMTKFLLRESMKGILPEKIRNRRDKMGFETPQDEWFRTDAWQNIVLSILNSRSFRERNLVDPEKAKEQYLKHLSGKINIAKEIWKWVHLELWFREFIDKTE
jgi:asparagine synthase (glutamine-hydrolysing)